LIEELIYRQGAFFKAAIGDSWLNLDLTMAQFKAACALSIDQPTTVGALGQRLGIGLPAASHIVERLVRLSLADRYDDPRARRGRSGAGQAGGPRRDGRASRAGQAPSTAAAPRDGADRSRRACGPRVRRHQLLS